MAVYVYAGIIEGDVASGYNIYFPDIPGCASAGKTQTLAALNASVGLAGHIELMLADGDMPPAPTPIELLKGLSDETEVGRILVVAHVDGAGRVMNS